MSKKSLFFHKTLVSSQRDASFDETDYHFLDNLYI